MPKLRPPSWKTLVKIFKAEGFEVDRIAGDHVVMTKPGIARPVVFPRVKEVSVFIVKNNLRTAGMSRARYFELIHS